MPIKQGWERGRSVLGNGQHPVSSVAGCPSLLIFAHLPGEKTPTWSISSYQLDVMNGELEGSLEVFFFYTILSYSLALFFGMMKGHTHTRAYKCTESLRKETLKGSKAGNKSL